MKHQILAPFLSVLMLSACTTHYFTVDGGDCDRHNATARIQVADLSRYTLTETTDGHRRAVPCQAIVEDDTTWLYFALPGMTKAGTQRTFRLCRTRRNKDGAMTVGDDGSSLILRSHGRDILQYNYMLSDVPQGVPQVFARSGYIHPARTPSGFIFTNIQPQDHRHHYGIWNPWTHVIYDGRLYDLWNLGDSLGTVRAHDVQAIWQGDLFAGFDATLQHVIFAPEGEKVIIDEEWKVRATDIGSAYVWDFESVLHPCADKPVTIQAYRYQGFSCRATDKWTRHNSTMMTSEGLERPQIDATTARWIYVNGESEGAQAGFMFLSFPENHNTPEPLRIWNEEANGGRGDVFVNFCPTKNSDWVLQPGMTYRLRYRVVAFDGTMTPQRAEEMWQDFAYPPIVSSIK